MKETAIKKKNAWAEKREKNKKQKKDLLFSTQEKLRQSLKNLKKKNNFSYNRKQKKSNPKNNKKNTKNHYD